MGKCNQTILSEISTSITDEEEWDKVAPKVRFALNTTINSATGKCVYELFLGYRPRGVGEAFIKNVLDISEGPVSLDALRAEASERTKNDQIKQKVRFDKKRSKLREYLVGERVLIRSPALGNDGESRKVIPKYKGRFVITKKLLIDRYCIEELPESYRLH